MERIVLRRNASPVYGFLSAIVEQGGEEEHSPGGRILDCGAGGPLPPLALFYQHGFDCWGIDVSEEQLALAQAYSDEHGMKLDLRKADMRQIPFGDCFFDHVYEHFSMCHLGKRDTAVTIGEMQRVLKPGGLCLLGMVSADSWPYVSFGEEREPGEFWSEEGDGQERVHSLFADGEADALVAGWDLLRKEKRIVTLHHLADRSSMEEWVELRPAGWTESSWRREYARRAVHFRYVHLTYWLKKGVRPA